MYPSSNMYAAAILAKPKRKSKNNTSKLKEINEVIAEFYEPNEEEKNNMIIWFIENFITRFVEDPQFRHHIKEKYRNSISPWLRLTDQGIDSMNILDKGNIFLDSSIYKMPKKNFFSVDKDFCVHVGTYRCRRRPNNRYFNFIFCKRKRNPFSSKLPGGLVTKIKYVYSLGSYKK